VGLQRAAARRSRILAVAYNESTAPEVLAELAGDKSESDVARDAAAANPSTLADLA